MGPVEHRSTNAVLLPCGAKPTAVHATKSLKLPVVRSANLSVAVHGNPDRTQECVSLNNPNAVRRL